MRLSKIKLLTVIAGIFVFCMTFTSAVYSDSQNGWYGYGLYNISNSKINILSEDVTIELQDGKLVYNGEFIIKNMTNSENRVALAMSANGVEKISMTEKGSFVKWKKRSLEGLQQEYELENQLPQENYWYVFNITLNPAETRIINVAVNAAQQLDEQGAYTISYFNDRKLGYSNKAEKSTLYLKINDFEPYDIISLKGLNPTEISRKGEVFVQANEADIEGISIKSKNITALALDKLLKSPMHKPREIALTFNEKNYEKAAVLCEEYLKNANDPGITNEQIQFIKAESQRRLFKYERYLEIVELMDYSKLYPIELKNKIFLDRINVYTALQSKNKIDNLSTELHQLNDESSDFLTAWMEDYGYFEEAAANKAELNKESPEKSEVEGTAATLIKEWYDKIIRYPYTPAAIFVFGLLTGLLIKRSGKRKRRRSMYVYRM